MANENRILTSHVGSLARPKKLLDYIAALDNGIAIDSGAFDTCLMESVAAVVERRARGEVDIVSNGKFGKYSTPFAIRALLWRSPEQCVSRRRRKRR